MHINIAEGIEAVLHMDTKWKQYKNKNTNTNNLQWQCEQLENIENAWPKTKTKKKTLTYLDINIMSPMLIIMVDTLTAPIICVMCYVL